MQAIKLQSDLEEIEENKGNLSKDLIEKNREALAWEKKWQLATETKENMKKEQSSEGEIGHMKAEIHRMTVRILLLSIIIHRTGKQAKTYKLFFLRSDTAN